jgi:hypothetical protein
MRWNAGGLLLVCNRVSVRELLNAVVREASLLLGRCGGALRSMRSGGLVEQCSVDIIGTVHQLGICPMLKVIDLRHLAAFVGM